MNRNQWADLLIATMGWQGGVADGIVAQAYSEGSQAGCNPLDTTEPWPGATGYNSAGVKNYASTADGLDATKATLENGLYGPVLSAGQQGDAIAYVNAVATSPWGTWPNTSLALASLAYVQSHPEVGLAEVAGTAPEPTKEQLMPAVVTPDGKVKVYAVGAGSRAGQLLEFTRDPADPTSNSVISVTDQIADPDPYTVGAL